MGKLSSYSQVTTPLITDTIPITSGGATHNVPLSSLPKGVTKTVATAASGLVADYICTGTADDVQIQLAINAVGATGGKILIRAGTYSISSAINILYSNIIICGEGKITLLQSAANSTFSDMITVGDGVSSNYGYVEIRSLSLDGSLTSRVVYPQNGIHLNKASHCIIEDVVANNFIAYDIWIENNGNYNRISNCEANNGGFDGIVCNFSNDNLFENNTCQGSVHGGIYIKGGTNNTIVGNNCDANHMGIWLQYTTLAIAIGNLCSNNTFGSGIGVLESDQLIISNNTCTSNAYDGMELGSLKNSIVSNNICNGNGTSGVQTSAGVGQHGIYLYKDAQQNYGRNYDPIRNQLTNNQCGNFSGVTQKYGILENGAANNNTIIGNILFSNATTNLTTVGASDVISLNQSL